MSATPNSNASPPTNNLQALLRFLAQDAKLPLATAMAQAALLQKASLGSPEAIATCKLDTLSSAVKLDEKQTKQVWNAAKRVSKKRQLQAGEDTLEEDRSSRKKKKITNMTNAEKDSPEEIERALALPKPETDVELISDTVLFTNRAPLMLAFTVTLLEYTMPEQPLSSRLSLAQAVVSTGAKKKAISLGIESGPGAEDEGWGEGQPVVRIMGRDISVMRRWDYEAQKQDKEVNAEQQQHDTEVDKAGEDKPSEREEAEIALWGLDLEALKKSNGPPVPSMHSNSSAMLPVYHAHSARNYLYKSFGNKATSTSTASKASKKGGASEAEKNLALLLGALKLLYESWASTLDHVELDRRAWRWYLHSRPDVDQGVAGWGGKGEVSLKRILDLRR